MSGFHWIAAYPKSGSTWLRLLLGSLSLGGGAVDFRRRVEMAPVASDRASLDARLDAQSGDLDPDAAEALRPRFYEAEARAASGPLLRMAYDAWVLTRSGEPLFPPHLTLAAVHLVRDPRDVAVSLSHHLKLPLDGAIDFMSRPDAAFSGNRRAGTLQLRQRLLTWSEHARSWLEAPSVPLLVRYEDLLADTPAELGRVARHLGWDASATALEGAAAATRFDSLRNQEERHGFRHNPISGGRFFRQGAAGGWRAVLSGAQSARIEREHGSVMGRLGYR
ncbi:MAG TPA: sulfotransferase domain-containing protein [Azospirillaceae bacterium]|nr:sulfotransferase domain-containing protein [Azospirillaceae bacterium]